MVPAVGVALYQGPRAEALQLRALWTPKPYSPEPLIRSPKPPNP